MADGTLLRLGGPLLILNGNATFTNFAVSASNSAVEYIFQAPYADTITRIGFRYGVRTGTPPTYRVSLQGVGATGNPDGTIKGGGSPASATFTPPADTTWNSTWQWVTLSNSYACARGEFLAVVIDYSSGTINGSNNGSFTSTVGYEGGGTAGWPYAIQNSATVRTRQGSLPVWGYGSAGVAYGHPMQTINVLSHTSATTPDEYALAFNLNAGYGSSYQVAGIRANFQMPAGGSLKAQLYNGTTVLQSATFDSDNQAAVASRPNEIYFADANLNALNFGSVYRVGLQPQDTASSYFMFSIGLAAQADAVAYPGANQFYGSSRVDAGAWTDDLTSRPLIELILADWSQSLIIPMRRYVR